MAAPEATGTAKSPGTPGALPGRSLQTMTNDTEVREGLIDYQEIDR